MLILEKLIRKYKEILLYIIFGVLTTAVNIATYFIFTKLLNIEYLFSNVIAWIASVLFAYVTNRIYVFKSHGTGVYAVIREMLSFFGCRLFSFFLDMALMYTIIDLLKFNDVIVKIAVNIIVVILNYLLSKLLVFKNKN